MEEAITEHTETKKFKGFGPYLRWFVYEKHETSARKFAENLNGMGHVRLTALMKQFKIPSKKVIEKIQEPYPDFLLDYTPYAKERGQMLLMDEVGNAIETLVIPDFADCDFAKRHSGIAMASGKSHDDILASDILMLRPITDFDVISYGEPHWIVTEETELVRLLFQGLTDDEWMIRAKHKDIAQAPLAKSKVRELYQIKGFIRRF